MTVPHRFERAGICLPCKLHLACELNQAQSIAALNFFYQSIRDFQENNFAATRIFGITSQLQHHDVEMLRQM